MAETIRRHRTAMERTAMSRPVALALSDAVITQDTTVFDYGCGHGGDIRRLAHMGHTAAGWDPAHRSDAEHTRSNVVNLGFVLNVIERPTERESTLRKAWDLTEDVLVVSARMSWEARQLRGRLHGDGIVTSTGTFQKLYTQEELRGFIETTLRVDAIAAAPGIFYVFRNNGRAQQYLAGRIRRRQRTRPGISAKLFDEHRELFEELAAFLDERGRIPRPEELASADEIRDQIGTIRQAVAVLRRVSGPDRWERITTERARDLIVYLALAALSGRPRFSELPDDLRYDVKDFFGSYKSACGQADKLLFGAGDLVQVNTACRAATVGKLTHQALYVHTSALAALPPLLRVYEGCGRTLSGTVDEATIIKLHRLKSQASYLEYPDFDADPHPTLATVVIARLGVMDITFKDFRDSENPPILHRKETFVEADYPGRDKFARLTRQEERHGLFEEPHMIGTREGWARRVQRAGWEFRGHRLVRTSHAASGPG